MQLALAFITSSAFHDDFRDVYAQIQKRLKKKKKILTLRKLSSYYIIILFIFILFIHILFTL